MCLWLRQSTEGEIQKRFIDQSKTLWRKDVQKVCKRPFVHLFVLLSINNFLNFSMRVRNRRLFTQLCKQEMTQSRKLVDGFMVLSLVMSLVKYSEFVWRRFFFFFFFFFKSIQNGETYIRSKPGNLSQTCRHLSASRWAAGLSCVRFIGKSKHRKSMMRNENFRFMRERASKLLYRPTTTTFCLAWVGTQHVLRLASRFWHKNSACALVFSPSDPEQSCRPLKCMFIPWEAYFFFENMVSWNTLDVSPDDFLRFQRVWKRSCMRTTRGSTFQTKRSEKCKGHAMYRIVTVYRAVTVYWAWPISQSSWYYFQVGKVCTYLIVQLLISKIKWFVFYIYKMSHGVYGPGKLGAYSFFLSFFTFLIISFFFWELLVLIGWVKRKR